MGVALPKMANYPGGFSHGITIRGIPLTVTHPGEVFWVDENASCTGRGTFKNPDVSIDTAIGRCVADRGDIIMVKPNHVENISAAADMVCDIAGVAIIGLGIGETQAKIVWDTADTADIDVSAPSVAFKNLWLHNNYANVDGAFDVATTGKYFTIDGCRWTDGSAALDIEEGVNLGAAANNFAFIGNDVRMYTAGDNESLVYTVGECIDMTVIGNSIVMAASAAIFDCNATALTGTPLFRDNLMINLNAAGTALCVSIDATTIGIFCGERMGSNKAGVVPVATATGSYFIDCVGVDEDASSSLIFPAAATVW